MAKTAAKAMAKIIAKATAKRKTIISKPSPLKTIIHLRAFSISIKVQKTIKRTSLLIL